MSRYKR